MGAADALRGCVIFVVADHLGVMCFATQLRSNFHADFPAAPRHKHMPEAELECGRLAV
jgi:hypothetical protein